MRVIDSSWHHWQTELSHRIGLQSDWLSSHVMPRRPWFLVPYAQELDAHQAQNLIETVRRNLLGTGTTFRITDVIHNIRSLAPDESLPLLFALRHVARHQASPGRYWPSCHEALFKPAVTLNQLRMRLAPELTASWLRLYEATRGALYFPREGKRNIKWPIAHAGFLPEDERLLMQFGQTLAKAYERDRNAAPLDSEQLDEFIDALLDWLEQRAYHGTQSILYRNLNSTTEGENLTIGEVAQLWLGQHWDEIESDESTEWQFRLPRRFLRFDPTRNRLQFVLAASTWPGSVQGQLRWDEQEYSLPVQLTDTERFSVLPAYSVSLKRPRWPKQAILQVDERAYHLSVPKPPIDSSLVFKSANGRLVHSLHLTEDYVVLIADNRLEEARDHLAEIFEDSWYPLGRPDGEWDGYTLLAVRVRHDLFDRHWLDRENELAGRIAQIESATDALGLPSFGHLWRPQIRLIGGSVQAIKGEESVYAQNDPPYLEVLGFWDDVLPVNIRQWQESSHEYFPYYRCTVSHPSILASTMIEIWELGHQPPAGRYAVFIGDTLQLFFSLEAIRSEVTIGSQARLALNVWYADQVIALKELSTSLLEHCHFEVMGWPLARLTLTVSSGVLARSVSISLSETGATKFRWKDLGLDLPIANKLTMRVAWRNILHTEAVFTDRPYVLPEEWQVNWQDLPAGILAIETHVYRQANNSQAELVVLGTRPWRGQYWAKQIAIDQTGHVATLISTDSNEAQWLLIGRVRRGEREPDAVWGATEIQGSTSNLVERWSDLQAGAWDRIAYLAELNHASIALPSGLIDTLRMVKAGILLREFALLKADWQVRWKALADRRHLAMYARWRALDFQPVPILLGLLPVDWTQPNPPQLSAYLTCIGRAFEPNVSYALESQRHLRPGQSVKGDLVLQLDQDSARFCIRVGETLHLCKKCGLILPSNIFWGHPSSVKHGVSCTAMNAQVEEWRAGDKRTVFAAVQINPVEILQALLKFVGQVMQSEEDVPADEEPWLDRLNAEYRRASKGMESPHSWLYELHSLLEGLTRLIERDTMDREQVIKLGHLLERHHDTFVILYQWMLDLSR